MFPALTDLHEFRSRGTSTPAARSNIHALRRQRARPHSPNRKQTGWQERLQEIGRHRYMTAQVTSRIVNGVAVVSVDGELDVHTSPKLRSSIRHMLAEGQSRIIVNLLKTTYLDGQAVAVLAATQLQARAAGGNIGFVHYQPLFTRLFSLAGVRGAFPAFRTEALAVRAARRWTGTSPRS
ncbi:MAG TPA: STAS domain-containing protein [bacterium]|nr:STAS domain-containing protein [bacterium]